MPTTAVRGEKGNLFTAQSLRLPQEIMEDILITESFRLERIISTGQATPAGEWYDQETDEWVLLLTGEAGLRFEHDPQVIVLQPGDYFLIPAHCRHRVEWTAPGRASVWLALHFQGRR